jgi:hypothetical protein
LTLLTYIHSYIKELADRVNRLEGRTEEIGLGYAGGSGMRRPSEDFSRPPSAENNLQRKRSFSSAGLGSPYQTTKVLAGNAWVPQERHLPPPPPSSFQTIQAAQTSSGHQNFRDPIFTPNGFPPAPQWKPTASDVSRLQSSAFEDLGAGVLPGRQHQHDSAVIAEYVFAISPASKRLTDSDITLSSILHTPYSHMIRLN